MQLQETLKLIEDITDKKSSEDLIIKHLRNVSIQNEEEKLQLSYEMLAFGFLECEINKDSLWDTYYQPWAVLNNPDGTKYGVPDINQITSFTLQYWEWRINETQNPLLIIRYTGLLIDFKQKITKERLHHSIVTNHINSIIDLASQNIHAVPTEVFKKLKRGLVLSTALKNKELIQKLKDTILKYEGLHSVDVSPGLWGYAFDLLIFNKYVILTELEESSIVYELENKLERSVCAADNQSWPAENAAKRLAKYYRKKGQIEKMKSALLKVGDIYERFIVETGSPFAAAELEDLYEIYEEFGMKEESNKILVKIRELGPKYEAQLQAVGSKQHVDREVIEKYLLDMTQGNTSQIIHRFINCFIPKIYECEKALKESSKTEPLLYISPTSILDKKGRKTATINSIEEDFEGHLIRYISDDLVYSSFGLHIILNEIVEKSIIKEGEIIEFLKKCPVINEDRINLLSKALNAFYAGDYIIFLHLVIPQIEEAMRNLLEELGGIVMKPSKGGGFHLKSFDEILRDKLIVESFTLDLVTYYRIVFTDQRGWNLRNDICHGMSNLNEFNLKNAARVLHALLCLGLISKAV
jgi:hypothetical protein